MKNNKMYSLHTDFYQLKMIFANVILGKGNEKVGFEGFVREIKDRVNPYTNFYIFDGEYEIKEFMENFKNEIKSEEFINTFIELIEGKLPQENKNELISLFKTNYKKLDFDFNFKVMENGQKVFVGVPVYQFYGARAFGQLIETFGTNIYNGKTGLATVKWLIKNNYDLKITKEEVQFLTDLLNNKEETLKIYEKEIEEKSKTIRNVTDKIILEAGFRRSPNYETALIASKIAIKNGWEGTSNTSGYFDCSVDINKINGTIAHAFIMGFKTEREAFLAIDKIFPGESPPVDTYNVENCLKLIKEMIINKEIKPFKDVRIDSSPLDEYCFKSTEILNGLNINNYISGDISEEVLKNFDERNISYKKAMIGTKLVYPKKIYDNINPGFVYKLVKQEIDGEVIYPEKKSTGKSNVPGLKHIVYDEKNNVINVYSKTDKFGFENYINIKDDVKINFVD